MLHQKVKSIQLSFLFKHKPHDALLGDLNQSVAFWSSSLETGDKSSSLETKTGLAPGTSRALVKVWKTLDPLGFAEEWFLWL